MEREIEKYFSLLNQEYQEPHLTKSERIIKESEEEFTGFSKEHQERQKERSEILEQIKECRKKLKTLKNVRNVNQRRANKQKAEKRAKIKNKISRLRVRLSEIDDEEPAQE